MYDLCCKKCCHSRWPAKFLAAGHLFPRKIGRQLASACSLVESMLMFSTAACSAKSAMYSVLTHFHADTPSPEACFLHGRVPSGADPHGNIKDESLVDDLRCRQRRRLAEGGDPHSKLPRLLELTPTTGKLWYRPDMTAEHQCCTTRLRPNTGRNVHHMVSAR